MTIRITVAEDGTEDSISIAIQNAELTQHTGDDENALTVAALIVRQAFDQFDKVDAEPVVAARTDETVIVEHEDYEGAFIGTSYFPTFGAALDWFRHFGDSAFKMADIEQREADGTITIGATPPHGSDEEVFIMRSANGGEMYAIRPRVG